MRAVIFVLLLLVALPVRAQEALEPWVLAVGTELPPAELLDPPGTRFVPVTQGALVPFTGMLLDDATLARWVATRSWLQERLKTDTARLREVLKAQQEANSVVLRGTTESYQREIAGLREDLRAQAKAFERAKQVPFYRTWAFGLVCGVVLSGVVTGVSTWAATK